MADTSPVEFDKDGWPERLILSRSHQSEIVEYMQPWGEAEEDDRLYIRADTIAALRAAPVAMRAALRQMIALTDELCTAVDCEADDIGGQRKSITILRELGQCAEKTKAALPLDAPVDYNPSLRGQWNFPDLFVEPAGFGRPAFTDEEAPPADPYLDAPAPVDPVAEAAKRVRKFITEWGRLTMRDGDIQALHVNTEREAMLTVADLERLVAAQEARHD
jgi:hypothetical protein